MTERAKRCESRGAVDVASDLEALRERAKFRGPTAASEDHEHSNDHMALIYESRDEQFATVVPFIRRGLERDERCMYIADEHSRNEILETLRETDIDVESAVESGALEVFSVEETYLEDGSFDLQDSIALLEDAIEAGSTEFEGLRVASEETWLLDEDSAIEDFMQLESRVNDLFEGRECKAVCQYNRERFPPTVISEVIRTHPHLIYDSRVNRNVYYTPPEEFFGPDHQASSVDRKLRTLQKRSETEQDHQRVIEALEAAEEGISLLDDQGEFVYVNEAYADTFGYEPDEMVGEHWDDLGIEADPEYVYEEVLPAVEREGQWTGTTTCVRSDDSTFFAQHSLTQTNNDELICVLRDVTERKNREQQLEELVERLEASNERLEQFAYAASHDLQEPLRMVSSYLQLIEDRYADELDEDGQEFIDFAVDGADRMREMIDGLLEYSRIERQGDPLAPTDLEAVFDDVLADLQVRIAESDAEITADDLPTVEGDASQLRQVFQNLLENAIEYRGDEPPRIHVSADRDGAKWVVSVRDNGIGLDSEDQDRIFEVFERLHTSDEYEGVGIGLALCQRIVERHGGDIWVDSEPGEGTTFSVTLPAVD